MKLRPHCVFDLNANLTPLREMNNGILTVTRFDILTSFWGPFQHLTPFTSTFETLFVIWDPFQHLRPFSFNIWDLIRYLRHFSAIETLFIQHLRPYSLFEALFSNWDPLHSTFETLLSIWDPFQHLTPFWRTRPPIEGRHPTQLSMFRAIISILTENEDTIVSCDETVGFQREEPCTNHINTPYIFTVLYLILIHLWN